MPYKHFGTRLARLDRFDSCTLHQVCAGSSTDQNSWPTPNRCGFNSRTAHQFELAGLARRSSPRSITARRWFDSDIVRGTSRGATALKTHQSILCILKIGCASLQLSTIDFRAFIESRILNGGGGGNGQRTCQTLMFHSEAIGFGMADAKKP